MPKFIKGSLGTLVIAIALILAATPARATDISGTISSTMTIFDNSRLVGNVSCTVPNAPCIEFGTSNITLDLNGFIMSSPQQLCSGSMGVATNSQTNVKINGPGVIRGGFGIGIEIHGGATNNVNGVTVSVTCGGPGFTGIHLGDTSDNDVEGNTVVGTSASSFGIPSTPSFGILLTGSSNNRVRHNESIGYVNGVVLVVVPGGVTTGNLVEENDVLGNTRGIEIGAGATGNLVRRNAAFDNGLTDIFDNNAAAGANTYLDNLCDVSTGTGAAGVCPNIPSFAGHRNVQ